MSNDYKTMTTAEIRESFLRFFEEKGCKRYPSSSLVPEDPSLLLANAGMNQFKEYYQGLKTMPEIGSCSCQKCVRTGDIDNIGDSRHLSFFEMLGNFSFGGYSKADAIAWAWEFITSEQYLGLPPERLYTTVFEDDDEAIELWHKQGVPYDHISRLGAEDNFWAAGPTGPCGPCSEIYFDQGPEFEGEAPGDDGDRYLEFWNLVFTQYDRQEDGSMPDLPHKNIDTGMGLERIAAIMQHKGTNYDGDVLRTLIDVGQELSGKTYGKDPRADRSMRIVADHSRAVTFMIGDGILPGNEGRGYVLRRLLRRAVYHGRLLGIQGMFLARYSEEVMRLMADVYPELTENKALILSLLTAEEERFNGTLDVGEERLNSALSELADVAQLPGEVAFLLHDTYGFPIDLTREICESAGHGIDLEGFEREMELQRERGRAQANRDAWGSFSDVWVALNDRLEATEFCGYEDDTLAETMVVALVVDGAEVESVTEGTEVSVVLNKTPFYAEMGGQVGDTGLLEAAGVAVRVKDTRTHEGLYAHTGVVSEGTLSIGTVVRAVVDHGRRELIRRNHTATHLLDAALKQVLGDHVKQAGSLVAPDRLRFDFTHFEAMTQDELARVEGLVNAEIFAAEPMVTHVMPIDEAKASGAIALFGEKYGDVVRVVSTGSSDTPFSRELCGGTHVANTAEIGLFKIISESSVGSNARRIEAVSSVGAIQYADECIDILNQTARALKCKPVEVEQRVVQLQGDTKVLQKRLSDALSGVSQAGKLAYTPVDLNGYSCVFTQLDSPISGKEIRQVWDGIRDNAGRAEIACVVAAPTPEGKVALLAAGSDTAVAAGFNAGQVVKEIAGIVGGKGGGRPQMAQAGGSDPVRIPEALTAAREFLGA